MEEYAALVAIDWADQQHAVSLYNVQTGCREQSIVKHTPATLRQWALSLRQRFEGRRIAVCLEQARGPLVYALMEYDFIVLYPVNPVMLANFRKAFSPALGKDDPSDADYLLDLLRLHRDRLRAWYPEDPEIRTLRLLVEQRRRLVNDCNRLTNRLTETLKGYFPQVLNWFADLNTHLVCDFLTRWPTLQQLQKVRRDTLFKFLKNRRSVRQATNERRWAELKTAIPLTNDVVILRTAPLQVKVLVTQLRPTIAAIADYEKQIVALATSLEDYQIFASFPGAGPLHTARLMAGFGADRRRWLKLDELLCYSGVAPVIESSGKQHWTRWRYFCPKFLRQTFVEYAAESIKHSFWARAFYQLQLTRGKEHHAAVRALAFKWMRILWKCWQTRTQYNETIYLNNLRNKGSFLLSFAATNQGDKTS